jgi:hypothetical protein
MSCNSSSPAATYSIQYFYNPNCSDCNSTCGGTTYNSACVIFNAPNLACSGVLTGDSVEVALQKIDTQICSAIGDYSTYQFNCLEDWWESTITQESQFVDAITAYACYINTTLTTFTGTTFPAYQTTVADAFSSITSPAIACASASVIDSDTLTQVLNKYCTKFGQIDTALSLSGITWSQCFSVPTPPLTIAGGFTLLIDQICQVKTLASGGALPTFNNSGNCLAGSVSDDLITTIDLITTRLCQTETFDATSILWDCLDNSATSLQDAFQTVVDKTNVLVKNYAQYSGDFIVTQTDGGDPCQGITISLATPIDQDRFVAVDGIDASPGTLIDKISAGIGITLNNLGSTLEIEASGTADSFQVLADATDDTPGYLDEKLNGGTDNGITITPTYNSGTKQVDLLPTINASTLFTYLLNQLDTDSTLYALFCAKLAGCPSPCDAPTNVQVVQETTTSTTTTTAA